jgi:hypothetical protein
MSTFDYEDLRNTADELIAEFGRGAGLRRKVDGGTSTRACTVVEVDYKDNERDGQIVRQKDRRFLCAAGGVVALPPDSEEDKLFIDGVELRIVNAEKIKPAETAVVYILQTRL